MTNKQTYRMDFIHDLRNLFSAAHFADFFFFITQSTSYHKIYITTSRYSTISLPRTRHDTPTNLFPTHNKNYHFFLVRQDFFNSFAPRRCALARSSGRWMFAFCARTRNDRLWPRNRWESNASRGPLLLGFYPGVQLYDGQVHPAELCGRSSNARDQLFKYIW